MCLHVGGGGCGCGVTVGVRACEWGVCVGMGGADGCMCERLACGRWACVQCKCVCVCVCVCVWWERWSRLRPLHAQPCSIREPLFGENKNNDTNASSCFHRLLFTSGEEKESPERKKAKPDEESDNREDAESAKKAEPGGGVKPEEAKPSPSVGKSGIKTGVKRLAGGKYRPGPLCSKVPRSTGSPGAAPARPTGAGPGAAPERAPEPQTPPRPGPSGLQQQHGGARGAGTREKPYCVDHVVKNIEMIFNMVKK